jgi:ribosomal protein S18 acetylase RimI-like enzyme
MIVTRVMTGEDLPAVLDLWRASEGIVLGQSDTSQQVAAFLSRNPGLSQVAVEEGALIGAVLCGHDGRRGFLHHLAVARSHRHRGIGRALVERCVAGLAREGIRRCHLLVLEENRAARGFWERIGWSLRESLRIMSRDIQNPPGDNG